MRALAPEIMLKAFGYGIYMAELGGPSPIKNRPNGHSDTRQNEFVRRLARTGIAFSEVVLDTEDDTRAYGMSPEGHLPTKYELALIAEEDWERIRTAVDMWGTQGFSDRLIMLEKHRPTPLETVTP
jgi:hypothetical protein